MPPAPKRPRKQRSDAAATRARILDAAARTLGDSPNASMATVAAAADVSRATLYRHFPVRTDLLAALNEQARAAADVGLDELRPPGELARAAPTPLSVADVLNKVPPHLLGEQIVAEAQRLAGVTSAAVYLIDLDGRELVRLAGPASFPRAVPVPLAIGTEVPREGFPAMLAALHERLPAVEATPLTLRGRAIGALAALGAAEGDLPDLAYEAAAALDLGTAYTDELDRARRSRPTSAAAEVQQNLLPPRIVRTNGANVAGNVLPGYEVGGDWFDYAENADGTWIGIADAMGQGPPAAAIAAVALGAFRSARHQRLDLEETVRFIDRTVRDVPMDATISLTIGFWIPPASTFQWISCGELGPIVVDAAGDGELLATSTTTMLGTTEGVGDLEVHARRLRDGDRVVLASDGVLARTSAEDEPFGTQGVVDAVRGAPFASAAGAVAAIETTVEALNPAALVDDVTLVVLAPVFAAPDDEPGPRR